MGENVYPYCDFSTHQTADDFLQPGDVDSMCDPHYVELDAVSPASRRENESSTCHVDDIGTVLTVGE